MHDVCVWMYVCSGVSGNCEKTIESVLTKLHTMIGILSRSAKTEILETIACVDIMHRNKQLVEMHFDT